MRIIKIVLLVLPFLVGFAPAPPLRPINDPDQAVLKFDRQIKDCPRDRLIQQRRHLIGRLEELQNQLSKSNRSDEASAIRDLVVFVCSLNSNHRLGKDNPLSLIRLASVDGKYRNLLHVIHAPNDQTVNGGEKDFGFWNGNTYATHENLKPGYWVYVYPRWFVWCDVNADVK